MDGMLEFLKWAEDKQIGRRHFSSLSDLKTTDSDNVRRNESFGGTSQGQFPRHYSNTESQVLPPQI